MAPKLKPRAGALHIVARARVLTLLAFAAVAGVTPAGATAPFAPLELTAPFGVIDGDTFEADLDGDGRVDLPRERIRLLYVDTPELRESDKGVDLVRGGAARALLASWLNKGAVTLLIPTRRARDNYGRTLGVLRVSGEEVNLILVREGLSYFDTRFTFPEDYDRYADAEGEAFSARRGIWSDSDSRERNLRRLEREWKTPRSPDNPLYAGSFSAETFDWRAANNKYVRVRGRMVLVDGTRPQSVQVNLETSPGREPVRAVLFHPLTERLPMTKWPPGATVVLEGFVRGYRNRPTIIIHYAAPLPRLATGAQPPHSATALADTAGHGTPDPAR
jgi:endonuclease YncB( thermonuclease family)